MDFATVWNATTQTADWCMDGADLGTDAGLTTAVIISLMTDRLANADDVIPDGTTDRRGTWMDLPLDTTAKADAIPDLMGSRWWLLARAKATEETRQNFIAYTQEALAWGVDDGAWDAVDVQAWLVPIGQLVGIVTITRQTATGPVNHLFDLAWNATMGGNVTAQGVAAFAPTIVPLAYPDPPTALTVTGTTATGASLVWSPAATGGTAATFTVQASLHGAGAWSAVGNITAPATGMTVSGLTAGTSYDFAVFATNATGNSANSATFTATTATYPPQAATSIAAASASPAYSAAAVSWVAPAITGVHAAATGYTVYYRIDGTTPWTQFATGIAALGVTVTGLAHNTSYDFLVIPYNSGGSSSVNNSVSGYVTATAAPNVPTGLAASAGSPAYSAAALSWSASATDGTHDAAATYAVQYRITGAGSWTAGPSGVTGTTTAVTGLAHATAYDFQVEAVNGGGASAFTATANVTTAALAPNVPTSVSTSGATSTSFVVSWAAAAVDGTHDAPTSYTVQIQVSGTGSWDAYHGITGLTATLPGLTSNVSWNVQVASVNSAGTSAFTSTVTTYTPQSSTSVSASWDALQYTMVHGSTGNTFSAYTTEGAESATVAIGISSTNTVAPTSYASATKPSWEWVASVTAPATAGTYYPWAIARDGSSNVLWTIIGPPITVT